MKKLIEEAFDYVKENILITILICVIITILSPLIMTLNLNVPLFDFTTTGQIGDTIGGITSPIINILNAILIYVAFTEQLKANNLLKYQIDIEKSKEAKRLLEIKDLIIFDLRYNILPSLTRIDLEITNYISRDQNTTEIRTLNNHVEFSTAIYMNLDQKDLLKIFKENFKTILQIYSRVDYINSITPVRISKRYPTDRDSLELINLNNEQANRIVLRHNQKINIILESAQNTAIILCRNNIEHILSLYTNYLFD